MGLIVGQASCELTSTISHGHCDEIKN